MRVAAARLRPYTLPLKRPWVAAAATLRERRGMLLGLTAADGIVGWGDCAPLPSSGAAGHQRAFAALRALAARLPGNDRDGALALASRSAVPEVHWALETALLDVEAKACGVPLACLLGAADAAPVPVNAALGALGAACVGRAQAALDRGFAIGKIKVGVAGVEREIAALRDVVRATDGRLRLRLDANRAWSAADARRFLMAVAELPIDGVEEPLVAPTPDELARLQAALPFALAVDESLAELGAAALFEARAVRRLVVKPARVGGIAATLELARRAQAAGMETVITSVVDSAIGVTAAAHVAASLPGPAHGLATSDWLARDVAEAPLLRGGALILGDDAGLGRVPFGEPA